ncbi:MAG: hypothetical protein E6Q32_05545 [Neisseriales bacterium]|nr:MAG: hypothetical protein E6Q32_05545 [Neisseriales bacterium]
MKKKLIGVVCLFALAACGGGGGGSSTPTQPVDPNFSDSPTPPSPYPTPGTYYGKSYSALGQPTGLTESYPSAFWPNNLHNALQIAYGNNGESQIANLAAYVNMSGALCSATPVYYESSSNTTFLIGAAHCFVQSKTSPTTLSAGNLISTSSLTVYNGVSKAKGWVGTYPVAAVYLRQDYCYNATFASGSECPNFTPNDGVVGGQGNDIAIIQVTGQYADPESYPKVVPAREYPQTYSAAPILSIGYGYNTQEPNGDLPAGCTAGSTCAIMFYTANYQYWQQDTTGYHYLYNSFYADTSYGSKYGTGYSSLVCGGDSGGGDLFWNGTNWLLLSEHTYGPSGACGTFYSYLPNAATNVSAYYDWIQSIIKDPAPAVNCKNGTIANCVTNG